MEKYSFVFFSRPGIGKTTLLATAAQDERTAPALMLDFEAHTLSIRSKIQLISVEDLCAGKIPETDKYLVVRIREWEELESVLDYFEENESPIKSIGVDSISEISYMNIRKICRRGTGRKPGISEDEPPDITHWQTYTVQMLRLVRRFRDLPQHIFLSAQLDEYSDPGTGLSLFKAALSGQEVPRQVGHLVDCIGYYFADREGKRIMQFTPNNRIIAKDGTEGSLFKENIDDPTITKLLDTIERSGQGILL